MTLTLDIPTPIYEVLTKWAAKRKQPVEVLLVKSLEEAAKAAQLAEQLAAVEPWAHPPFWGQGDKAVIAWQRDRAGFERLATVRKLLDDTAPDTPLWHQLRVELQKLEQRMGLSSTALEAG